MSAVLKIVDEHFGGPSPGRVPALELRLASQRVSAREIIRSRVEAEVAAINDRRRQNAGSAPSRSFLITPEKDSAETVLNTPPSLWRPAKAKMIDAAVEVERALKAFGGNRFILLLDDRQMEGLDDEVGLRPDSEVVFVFLTPLKGG